MKVLIITVIMRFFVLVTRCDGALHFRSHHLQVELASTTEQAVMLVLEHLCVVDGDL